MIDDRQKVVVVAELECLGTRHSETQERSPASWQKRVAPTQDRRPAVAGWHDQCVQIVRNRGDRIELEIAGGPAEPVAAGFGGLCCWPGVHPAKTGSAAAAAREPLPLPARSAD